MDAGTCLDDDDDARLFVAVSVSCSCSVSSSSSSSVGSRRGWGNLLFVIDETGSQGKEVRETGTAKWMRQELGLLIVLLTTRIAQTHSSLSMADDIM